MEQKKFKQILFESENETAFDKLMDKTKNRQISLNEYDYIKALNLAISKKLFRNGNPNISALFQELVQKDIETEIKQLIDFCENRIALFEKEKGCEKQLFELSLIINQLQKILI